MKCFLLKSKHFALVQAHKINVIAEEGWIDANTHQRVCACMLAGVCVHACVSCVSASILHACLQSRVGWVGMYFRLDWSTIFFDKLSNASSIKYFNEMSFSTQLIPNQWKTFRKRYDPKINIQNSPYSNMPYFRKWWLKLSHPRPSKTVPSPPIRKL